MRLRPTALQACISGLFPKPQLRGEPRRVSIMDVIGLKARSACRGFGPWVLEAIKGRDCGSPGRTAKGRTWWSIRPGDFNDNRLRFKPMEPKSNSFANSGPNPGRRG